VLLIAITSMVLAPSAGAAASNSVIKACYKSSTGALRLITGRGRCGHGESPISWNVAGRAGAHGPTGPAGFLGVPGFPGVNGVAGAASTVRGVTGATGAAGAAGVNGENGAAGAAGASPAGATGAVRGEAGAAGVNGKNGATGATGATGGTTGVSGAVTPTGATGIAGSPLPATLLTGQTEKGAWIVSELGKEPGLPSKLEASIISFPIPLASALEKSQVHYINPTKLKELETGCHEAEPGICSATEVPSEPGCFSPALEQKTPTLLEAPLAEPGNLCVYAGIQVLAPAEADVGFSAIENSVGSEGTDRTGASIRFTVKKIEPPKKITMRAQGTWAVTAG
jgi:hypothetical protein